MELVQSVVLNLRNPGMVILHPSIIFVKPVMIGIQLTCLLYFNAPIFLLSLSCLGKIANISQLLGDSRPVQHGWQGNVDANPFIHFLIKRWSTSLCSGILVIKNTAAVLSLDSISFRLPTFFPTNRSSWDSFWPLFRLWIVPRIP